MPAQPSICHNTAQPAVCLLSLLYVTIQPSLLCACSAFYMPQYSRLLYACSAFYMPQYSRAYCVPAQPSTCHNTAEPSVCLLKLLYATIQPSLLYACSGCCMPVQAIVCLLNLLYACSACCPPCRARLGPEPPRRARAARPAPAPCPGLAVLYCNTAQPFSLACHNCIAIQCPAKPAPSHNTISVLRHSPSCQALPIAIQSQTTAHILQYTTLYCNQPLLATIQKLYCNTIPCLTSLLYCNTTHPSSLSRAMSRYNTLSHNTIWAVAHPNFYCIFFSFFFFISSYWKITKKIYTYFFFSFSRILK